MHAKSEANALNEAGLSSPIRTDNCCDGVVKWSGEDSTRVGLVV